MNDPAPQPPSLFDNALHLPQAVRLMHVSHHVNNATVASGAIRVPGCLLELYRGGQVEVRVPSIGRRVMRARLGLLLPPRATYFERPLTRAAASGGGGRAPSATSTFMVFDDPSDAMPPSLGLGVSTPFWIEDPHGALQGLLDRTVAAVHGRGWMPLSATALFYQAMSLVASARRRGSTLTIGGTEDATPQFVVTANEFMREHLAHSLSIAQIAAEVGLSASGFSHAYRRATGRSPMTMLRALRIEAAKLHLVRGRLKLDAIAAQTGFADAFHLSRVFKRITGVSPREFLKTHATPG